MCKVSDRHSLVRVLCEPDKKNTQPNPTLLYSAVNLFYFSVFSFLFRLTDPTNWVGQQKKREKKIENLRKFIFIYDNIETMFYSFDSSSNL